MKQKKAQCVCGIWGMAEEGITVDKNSPRLGILEELFGPYLHLWYVQGNYKRYTEHLHGKSGLQ